MTHARKMLDTYPGSAAIDAAVFLGEGEVSHLRRCITMCLNCSEVCAATGRIVSRQTDFEPTMARAALQACAEACRLCAEECEHHAREMNMEHCRVCAEACRRCERACSDALSALGPRE